MKTLVIGGTGFIGYPIVNKLSDLGHEVTIFALPGKDHSHLFSDKVSIVCCNIANSDSKWLVEQLKGFDNLVFAAGADDRVIPKMPAFEFFYRENVINTFNLFSHAREAGIKQVILISSYFAYFNRQWPDLKLSHYHPYIRTRHKQQEMAKIACRDMRLCVLELPYVFGAKPGDAPLWTPLVNFIRSGIPLICVEGGTNAIDVWKVADAVVGALLREAEGILQVGDENVTWKSLYEKIAHYAGIENPKATVISKVYLSQIAVITNLYHRIHGKESGLHPVHFVKLQTRQTYFDSEPAMQALGYSGGGLDAAIEQTVLACPLTDRTKKINYFLGKLLSRRYAAGNRDPK